MDLERFTQDFHGFAWIYVNFNGFRCIYVDLHGFIWTCIDLTGFTLFFMDLGGISMTQGLPSSVMGWLAGQTWIFIVFQRFM